MTLSAPGRFLLVGFSVSLLTACEDGGGGDGTGGTGPELTPMSVTATHPDDQQDGVPIDRNIAVSFDQAVDPASLSAEGIVVAAGGETVLGQLSCTGDTVVFVTPELQVATEHTVTVGTSIHGLSGAILATPYTFTFTTGETYADGSPPRPADFNPFGAERFHALVRKAEYLLLGVDHDGSNVVWVDPLEFNSPEDPADPSDDVLNTAVNTDLIILNEKAAATGNLDDDFYDEVVAVSWEATGAGKVTVFDRADGAYPIETPSLSLEIDSRPNGEYAYDVALGDVDADGLDEIIIGGVIAGADASEQLGKVWIFDDHLAGYVELHSIELLGDFDAMLGYLGLDLITVATGNLDLDHGAEVVIGYHHSEQAHPCSLVLDDASASFEELRDGQVGEESVPGGATFQDRFIDIETGDIDRDGIDEIVLAWGEMDTEACEPNCTIGSDWFWLLDDHEADLAFLFEGHIPCGPFADPVSAHRSVHLADIDGDKAAEIIVFGCVMGYDYTGDHGGGTLHPAENGMCEETAEARFGDRLPGTAMAVDEVDGDFRDDLILFTEGRVDVVGCKEHPHYNPDTGELESITNHFELIDSRGPFGSAVGNALLVAPNVDGDSVIIERGIVAAGGTGGAGGAGGGGPEIREEHSLYFADNRIIAVLAAPPCGDGIGQNTIACSTGLGTSIGGSFTAGVSAAVRAGVLVGVSEEIQAGFLAATVTLESFELEVKAEVEVNTYMSATIGVSQTLTNYAGPGEDLVIFFTVPYDRYSYVVTSHPDGDLVGEPITIDVPQYPKILAVSREYYNATNGEQMDIGADVLPSTPGDLSTYLSLGDVPMHLLPPHIPLGPPVGPVTVNQGNGSKELELEMYQEFTAGQEVTLSVDSMVKLCVSFVCGGATAGFSIGAFAEVSLSSAMVFTSSVGALDADHFATEMYDYGMFAYIKPVLDPFGGTVQSFIVVNYWVD